MSEIIRPPHVFDFNLLLPIFPDAVIVGERLIRLGAVRSLGYEDLAVEADNKANTVFERTFVVSYMNGEPDYFNDDETREFQRELESFARRMSQQATEMQRVMDMNQKLALQNEQLQAELARRMMADEKAGKVIGPNFGRRT